MPRPAPARSRLVAAALGAAMLLTAGCALDEDPYFAEESEDSTSESGALEGALAGLHSPVEPEDARALLTPSGVIVPVTGIDGGNYLIETPCGVPSEIRQGTPIADITVALDPGHGGAVETGSVGANGLTEKELNLSIAQETAIVLAERGISSVLTRTGDYRIPLSGRAAIANQLEVELLVSIHHNAPTYDSSAVPGTEVYIQSDSPESSRLGTLIWESVTETLARADGVDWSSNGDPGVLRVIRTDNGEDSYGMIVRPDMPAVLAELGYLSNPSEADYFATDGYVDRVSVALADGIEQWLETDATGSGLRDEPRMFNPSGATGGGDDCEDPPLG